MSGEVKQKKKQNTIANSKTEHASSTEATKKDGSQSLDFEARLKFLQNQIDSYKTQMAAATGQMIKKKGNEKVLPVKRKHEEGYEEEKLNGQVQL